jgi:acetylornithine deacetylase
MVIAAEVLAEMGSPLAGDLIVSTVTDEETGGAGAVASVSHGVRADAGLIPEPTDFQLWLACRGALLPVITVAGRSGHSEIPQPHWRDGGPVNAIEKAAIILEALRRLREDWRERPDHQHPLLPPGDIVPTMISGGEWIVTYPASCTIACDVTYLPAHADENGWGSAVEREFTDWILRASQGDPWLAENPPHIEWGTDGPPVEIPEDERVAQVLLAVAGRIGVDTSVATRSAWHDGVTFTLFGNTPSVAFGPRSFHSAHTVDEFVPVGDLITCAKAFALSAIEFCGIDG